MEIFEDELLGYVKKELSMTNPDLDIDSITQNTDLSNLGIESIIIISLGTIDCFAIDIRHSVNISISS